jgi:hypothetical protein
VHLKIEATGADEYIYKGSGSTTVADYTNKPGIPLGMSIYGITGYADPKGNISARPAAGFGDVVFVTVSAAPNYEFVGNILINGSSETVVHDGGNTYHFTMPEGTAEITASAGAGDYIFRSTNADLYSLTVDWNGGTEMIVVAPSDGTYSLPTYDDSSVVAVNPIPIVGDDATISYVPTLENWDKVESLTITIRAQNGSQTIHTITVEG